MRVLHVCIYFRNPMFMGLMQAQEQIGIDKRVFYYETRKIGLKHFELPYVDSYSSNISFLPTPYLRFTRLKIVAKEMLRLYKNAHDFDCIHAHTLVADGYLALQFKKEYGIPYVITIRDSDMLFKQYWRLTIYRDILIDVLMNASKVVFLSKSSQKSFMKLLTDKEIVLMPDLCIIPNGIDNFWHDNTFYRSESLRTIDSTWKIITVGKVCERKNQLLTCQAIEQMRREGYSIEYEIVGKADDIRMIEKIKEYGFVKYKEFMTKEELIDEYRRNDIFLLASTNETFGLVYAEAMTQSLPIIYTRGQGFDEQFLEGEVGFSTSSSSIEEIKSAILKVINSYNDIIVRCVSDSRKFDWKLVAESLNDVYFSVAKIE